MKGKIQRHLIDAQTARMHEAVSDSVYVRGTRIANEGTLTQVLDDMATRHQLSFLHLSDNHGSLYGLNKMVALLGGDTDSFGINTGDITAYSSVNNYAPVIKVMTDWNAACNNKPILLLKGNHDTWDISAFRMQEKLCTSTLLKPVNNGFVVWGDPNSNNGSWSDSIIGGYFYKDIVKNGVKLRLIALDEYQHSVGDPRTDSLYYYTKVYSQAQVNWLINLLRSTPSDYYIIMAHHQPLYEYHPTNVLNDFVHHGINGSNPDSSHTYTNRMFTYKAGNLDMAARIVDAYQHKRLLSLSGYPSGVDGVTININADFRNCVPAKFACHINGHVHGDYCEYHPYFPQQLCLTIGTDSPTISNWYDDLVRSSGNTNNHAINRVTIDADRDVVIVERIGADTLNTSLNWITQDGSARKWIEFKIPATMEKDYYTKSEIDALNEKEIIPRVIDGHYLNNSYQITNGGFMNLYRVDAGDKLKLIVNRGYSYSVKSYMFLSTTDITNLTSADVLLSSVNHNTFIQGADTAIELEVPAGAKLLLCQGYGGTGTFGTNVYTYQRTNYRLFKKVPVTVAPPRKTFKILAVGNSFTCDELSYLPYVAKNVLPDVDIRMRILYLPTGTIKEYDDNRNSSTISRGSSTLTINGFDWFATRGSWSEGIPMTLEESIDADDWDVITFQQVSSSPVWSSVETPLTNLSTWLKQQKGYTGKIAWLLTHSYSDAGAANQQISGTTTSDAMYALNSTLAQSVIASGLVDLVIPSGTAIQNLRHTSLGSVVRNQFCDGTTSSPDIHLEEGFAPFAGACAAVATLLKANTQSARIEQPKAWWCIPNPNPNGSGVTPSYFINSLHEDLTDINQAIVCESVAKALTHPYNIYEDGQSVSDDLANQDVSQQQSGTSPQSVYRITASGYNSNSPQSTLTISGATYTEARDALQNGMMVEITIEGSSQNYNARMFFSVGYMMSGWFIDSSQDVFSPVVIVWNSTNCIAIKSSIKPKENIVIMLSSMGSMDDSQVATHVTDGLVYNEENHTIDTKSNNVVVSSEQPSAENIYVNLADDNIYRYSGGSSGSMKKLK